MIIAIEGQDAAGKATQARLLADRLGAARSLHSEVIAFPDYETATGQAILGHLKNHWACLGDSMKKNDRGEWDDEGTKCDALVFQALQTVNRLEALPRIRAAAAAGHVVLDRYYASGIVYGAIDGLDPTWLELVHESLPQPDLWLLLDVSPETSAKRRPERRDHYERQPGLMEKVRTQYLQLFDDKQRAYRRTPGHAIWEVVSAEGTIDETADAVWWSVELAMRLRP